MRRTALIALALVSAVACGGASEVAAIRATVPIPTPAPTTSTAPSATARPTTPAFRGSVSRIDDAIRARMTSSWRPGCPVDLGDLRLLRVTFWGFDGRVHPGEIVVHEDHARAVLGVFGALLDAGFPIERMELIDVYGGDDERSMAANNTSGFNCRRSAAGTGDWSQHAFGTAVDINPIQNPYVTSAGDVDPPAGERYADRSGRVHGMIRANDVVVRAFAEIGWEWGGSWTTSKDYQHFSENGG